jgi:hypothetical protein
MSYVLNMTDVVMAAILGGELPSWIPWWYWLTWNMMQVIMIAWLHAMYQRSRMMLLFLVIVFLAVNITCGVIVVIVLKDIVVGKLYLSTWRTPLIGQTLEELILSGMYICNYDWRGMPSFWPWWFGCSTLFGRSSHCVFQSGWLWSTSMTCNDLAHWQDQSSGIVSRCW